MGNNKVQCNLKNTYVEKKTIVLNVNDEYTIVPFYKDKRAIVIESSSFFVPYLDVLLLSIINNANVKNNYDIVVLTNEITDIDCLHLLNTVSKYNNISLRFFNPIKLVEKYIGKNKHNYLTINYFRLALPWILSQYDRAINLGADLVIKRDIEELFNVAFDNDEYMAGVSDLGYVGRIIMNDIPREELALTDPMKYVNADVLVFNLEKIRRDFTIDQIMEPWEKYELRCSEQDALNMLFDGHVKMLDLKWNCYPERMTSMEHIVWAPKEMFGMWEDAIKKPYIIHFAAVPKPWDYPNVGYGYMWWEVARKSVYYEEILRRMSILAIKGEMNSGKVTFGRRVLNLFFPKGSFVRRVLSRIFPKRSYQREVIKKVYYCVFDNPNKEWNRKFGKCK